MQKYLLGVAGGVAVLAASSFLLNSGPVVAQTHEYPCLLYTSDAADE